MERNDDENEEKEPIKVILLGDSGVGKTNIVLRYLKNEFNQNIYYWYYIRSERII